MTMGCSNCGGLVLSDVVAAETERVWLIRMAGVGTGHWASLDAACAQAIEVAERIEPDAADLATYKDGYAEWRKLYPALRSLE